MQDLLALLIGKVHIHHAHIAAKLGIGQRAVPVRVAPGPVAGVLVGLGDGAVGRDAAVDQRDIAVVRLGRLVHQGEDALGAGRGHDDGVDLLGEGVDVAGELLGHVQKRDEDADGKGLAGEGEIRHAGEQEHAADQRQRDIQHIADVADDRAEGAGKGVGPVAVLEEAVVDLVEFLDPLLLVAEDLDDLLAVHRLLDIAFVFGDRFLHLHERARRAAADPLGDNGHRHDAEKQHQRHPHGEVQHDRKHDQHDRTGLDEGGHRLGDELAERVDVVGIVAHDVAELVAVEIADGQILHAVEELAAHLVEEALGHIGHQLCLGRDGEDREHIQRREQHQIRRQLGLRRSPVAAADPFFDGGDDVLDEQRGDRRDDRGEEDAHDRKRREHGIEAEEQLDRAEKGVCVGFPFLLIHRAHLPCSAARRSRDRSRWTP